MDEPGIDHQALRRMTEEVNEQHDEAMRAVDDVLGVDGTDRRQFLTRAGLGGAAVAIGAGTVSLATLLADRAAAQSATTETLADSDAATLAFAQGMELAAVQAYDAAVASNRLDVVTTETARWFGLHHASAASSIGTLADKKAPNLANPGVVQLWVTPIKNATTQAAILQTLYELEESAAATYAKALDSLESRKAAELASSILPVEGQQAVVWGQALKLPTDQWMPNFQSQTDALDPQRFATS